MTPPAPPRSLLEHVEQLAVAGVELGQIRREMRRAVMRHLLATKAVHVGTYLAAIARGVSAFEITGWDVRCEWARGGLRALVYDATGADVDLDTLPAPPPPKTAPTASRGTRPGQTVERRPPPAIPRDRWERDD